MKKKKNVVHSSLSNFLLANRESEAWGESNQKIRSRGRSSFSWPFACICIYNVISVVQQNIGLLIKLFVVVV